MTIDAARFQKLLSEFKLDQIFNELGWDHAKLQPQEVTANGEAYTLNAVAQKRGVAVFSCAPDAEGKIPARPIQLKIEKETAKLAHEHLLIFTDAGKTALTWLWVSRAPGQPTVTRTHTWHEGTSGESLRQKLEAIVWSLEEEEAITLTDVIKGLRDAFDKDRISKRFYERFKSEHGAFSDFIEGLANTADKAWYASLMLNRLMFVYFIQRKGFLDDNPSYLSDRLQAVRTETGEGHFHSFYRVFLRRLFHEGLGTPKNARTAEFIRLVGRIPYLNGGLFDLHELEEANPDIDIPDEAFERLFEFFDAYDWHLDDRPLATGNEINPEVLGYIFEKYINQKQMGAYYTKEDITEYIGKNTVIPHLLEQARERCKVAFEGEESVWNLLEADPDRYLYPAMKTGVIDASGQIVPESALPEFVQTGMHDPKARMFDKRYNLREALFHTATGERGTLPTETWREYVERRKRCLEVREKLTNGEVESADDLITLNLNIRQFMQDVIDSSTGPRLLRAIWQAIVGRVPERANEKFRHGITILDPTCGSGAFLFAALNVLEPLYEACLDRMEGFVEDAKKLGKPAEADFARVLEEVGRHPSRSYFVYKSIVLHNLFGVDIMAEAVEICKLRLFLKLVSQVDRERELEPLPDMDFNIRCGNTLVGYATEAQFDEASRFFNSDHCQEIKASIADLADLFDRFREQQTVRGGKVTSEDKRTLRGRLDGLSLELDRYLAHDYGIDPDNTNAFADWRACHQPFHWVAEFYGVMREGGFDVVIGNPPYVEMHKVRSLYSARQLSITCGNLFAPVVERSQEVISGSGFVGVIVPLSLVATERMRTLREILSKTRAWLTSYDMRPASLFEGIAQRLTICILRPEKCASDVFTGGYRRWSVEARRTLFETIEYVKLGSYSAGDIIFKARSLTDIQILEKLGSSPLELHKDKSSPPIYVHRICRYFIKAFDFVPHFRSASGETGRSEDYKPFHFSRGQCSLIAGYLNTATFYWYWRGASDGFHCGYGDVFRTPYSAVLDSGAKEILEDLTGKLFESMRNHSRLKQIRSARGVIEYQEFYASRSKYVADQMDIVFGELWGLNDEELDYLVNYDIKYRMGGTDNTA